MIVFKHTFKREQALELDASLYIPQCVCRTLQLFDLGLCESLLNNVCDSIFTQDNWQTQENILIDRVITLE